MSRWFNPWPVGIGLENQNQIPILIYEIFQGLTSDYNWWISGGLDKDETPLKTSEVRWFNGTWTPGPVLPTKVYGHCITQIQRQKSVLIGGYPTYDNYIYDWITKVSIYWKNLV